MQVLACLRPIARKREPVGAWPVRRNVAEIVRRRLVAKKPACCAPKRVAVRVNGGLARRGASAPPPARNSARCVGLSGSSTEQDRPRPRGRESVPSTLVTLARKGGRVERAGPGAGNGKGSYEGPLTVEGISDRLEARAFTSACFSNGLGRRLVRQRQRCQRSDRSRASLTIHVFDDVVRRFEAIRRSDAGRRETSPSLVMLHGARDSVGRPRDESRVREPGTCEVRVLVIRTSGRRRLDASRVLSASGSQGLVAREGASLEEARDAA